ncbi:MAG: type II toxin-antitoxin system HicA family toxin [Acidobacteriota bacterium]
MKLPRDASGAAVVAALAKLGFERVRQNGSHVQLVKGSLRVTIPLHRSVVPGTLRSILRQARVDLDEFLNALR